MNFHIPPDLIRGPESDVLPLADAANWGVAKFGVDHLRAITDGSGVIAGIIDTGVDAMHPLLKGQFIGAKDFTGSLNGFADVNGHGTHCSGTVAAASPSIGMAPGARFVHGKALSDKGSGFGNWIRDAMQWCVDQGAEVLSMSLGSASEDTIITSKIAALAAQGIWIVCAAGNSGGKTQNVDWPARSPSCVSAAAIAENLMPASFTNAGAKIDTAFAGTNIWSCRPGGSYQQMSGTSMATPGVAGVLTLYRAALKKSGRPVPTIGELRKLLAFESTDAGEPGVDRRLGPGWISAALLSLNLTPDPAPIKP